MTMDMENGKQNNKKTTESRPDPAYYHSPSGSQEAVLQIMVQPEAKIPAPRDPLQGTVFGAEKLTRIVLDVAASLAIFPPTVL